MIQYISKPFKYFFKLESASGLVLLFAAVIALFISNSSLGENYFKILESYFTLGTKEFGLKLSVLHWINDVLMAVFFFLVSLEIKREFVKGELSNPKQAMLPIIGAVGGMVVPAAIYIIIAKAVRKTFKDIGTLFPSNDNTPNEKAISVADGIAQPLSLVLSSILIII